MLDTEAENILSHFEPPASEDGMLNYFLNLINLDALFAVSPNAISLNRLDSSAPDYVKQRNSLVFARAGSLNFIAHCDCGGLSGNLNIGQTCPDCLSTCRDDFSTSDQLEHNVWLSMPPAIPGVFHPIAYMVLAHWLSFRGGSNYLDVIIDAAEPLPPELEGIVLGRGYAYLYENFDALMAHFVHFFRHVDKRPSAKRRNVDYIEQFLKQYRDVIFCTKLPVMSSVLHSITSADGTTGGRQYADSSLQVILDAATDLQQVEETTIRTRPSAVSGVVHRIYKTYMSYIHDIAKTRLSRKKSLVRGHMLGTRLHFSVRTVIVPHMDRYDELYFPWGVTVNLLKLHIIGRLMRKHGMTIGEATSRQVTAIMHFDPTIDQIMKDLINECRPEFPGIPILFNRNPSLRRGAIQLLYMTRVKPDVDDKTINISTLVLKAPNADFDGDALNGVMLVEMDAARAYHVLHPSQRIRSTNASEISEDITLPKQSLVVLNNMLQSVG